LSPSSSRLPGAASTGHSRPRPDSPLGGLLDGGRRMTLAALPPELLSLAQRLAGLAPEQRAEAIGRMPPAQPQALVAAITAVPLLSASIGSAAVLTPRQVEADALLNGPAMHTLLVGGSRSGKTFTICRAIASRALQHPSRHAIFRYRFNSLHA